MDRQHSDLLDDHYYQFMATNAISNCKINKSTDVQQIKYKPQEPHKSPLIYIDKICHFLIKYFNNHTLHGDSLLLIVKIVSVYYQSVECEALMNLILNLANTQLSANELLLNDEYCACIIFLINHCNSSNYLKASSELSKEEWQRCLSLTSLFIDYLLLNPTIESLNTQSIMGQCLYNLSVALTNSDASLRNTAHCTLAFMIHSKSFVFNLNDVVLNEEWMISYVSICKSFNLRLFNITRLLDVLGRLTNQSTHTPYTIALIELTVLHALQIELNDPEIVVLKYILAVFLGFEQCKIVGLQLQIGPYTKVMTTECCLNCIKMIVDRQSSPLKTLQIDTSHLILQGCLSALHYNTYQWLEAIHVCLYYHLNDVPDVLITNVFTKLIHLQTTNENKELMLHIIECMIKESESLLMTWLDDVLELIYTTMDRFNINKSDNLAIKASLLLMVILQQPMIRNDFYSFLYADCKMIHYLLMIHQVQHLKRQLNVEILVNALHWEELRIDYYNRLLIYGIDSLMDVEDHFYIFIKISQELKQYSQQHAMELTRILNDILKKASTTRIDSKCAGYFLLSIGALIDKHGYFSISILENLRFNLDSFLCCFDIATDLTVDFFDVLKSVDVDLFEFTMITIYKSKLNKDMQTRAYSPKFMKYLPELQEHMMINMNLEEIMENAFDNNDYLQSSKLLSLLEVTGQLLINKIDRSKVLKVVIILLYSGFECKSYHFITQITQQHLELSKVVLESAIGQSTHQQSIRQSLLIQVFLIFKLTSFIQMNVLTDGSLIDALTLFEYGLWNGIVPMLLDGMHGDLMIVAGLELYEYASRNHARCDSVIKSGLQVIFDKMDLRQYQQKYNLLKQQVEVNGVLLNKTPMMQWKELTMEVQQLH